MPQRKREIINNKLKCSKCGYMLDVSLFGTAKNTSSGYRSYCKACQKSHYDNKRPKKVPQTVMLGRWTGICKKCQRHFISKSPISVFCSAKCRKRDWYEKNKKGIK